MNRLSLCVTYPTPPCDEKKDAQKHFSQLYNGIQYLSEKDRFLYRGTEFDYFKSAVYIGDRSEGQIDHYMLVDPENYTSNWLFTYGDPEDRWHDFVTRYKEFRRPLPNNEDKHYGFFRWLINRIF